MSAASFAMLCSFSPSFTSMCRTGIPQASVTFLLIRTWFSKRAGRSPKMLPETQEPA